jgi:phospholipid-translocating ATPase
MELMASPESKELDLLSTDTAA